MPGRYAEADDVILLWRHASSFCSQTLNTPKKAPFDGCWEIWPLNAVAHLLDPQKAHPGAKLRVLAIFRQNLSTGHFSRRVVGKNKNRKIFGVIFHAVSLRPIGKSFVLLVRFVDIIKCAKFYRSQLRGLDYVRSRSWTIPIGLRCRH